MVSAKLTPASLNSNLLVLFYSVNIHRFNPVQIVYLNFKKPFDKVLHQRLLKKFKHAMESEDRSFYGLVTV